MDENKYDNRYIQNIRELRLLTIWLRIQFIRSSILCFFCLEHEFLCVNCLQQQFDRIFGTNLIKKLCLDPGCLSPQSHTITTNASGLRMFSFPHVLWTRSRSSPSSQVFKTNCKCVKIVTSLPYLILIFLWLFIIGSSFPHYASDLACEAGTLKTFSLRCVHSSHSSLHILCSPPAGVCDGCNSVVFLCPIVNSCTWAAVVETRTLFPPSFNFAGLSKFFLAP